MTTAAILAALAAASTAVKAGGQIAAGAQEFNRDDRARLAKLERQQALGMLGMTPAQREASQRRILQPLQTIEQQAANERRAQLAAQDLGQGAAYRQMQMEEQVRQQGRLAAQQMLEEQQQMAISRQEQEMALLEDARKRRRQMMIMGGTQAVAEGIDIASQQQIQQAQLKREKAFYEMMSRKAGIEPTDISTFNTQFYNVDKEGEKQ